VKGNHVRVAAQQFLHAPFLDAPAFAVDDPHRPEIGVNTGFDIVLDQGFQVLWPEGVQVEDVLDGDTDRIHAIGI